MKGKYTVEEEKMDRIQPEVINQLEAIARESKGRVNTSNLMIQYAYLIGESRMPEEEVLPYLERKYKSEDGKK